MVLISIKTSNSLEEIERMVYWKYRSFSQALSRFMEKENKSSENGETPDVGAESKKMMRNAKSSLPKQNRLK